jgi:hypothetical protein
MALREVAAMLLVVVREVEELEVGGLGVEEEVEVLEVVVEGVGFKQGDRNWYLSHSESPAIVCRRIRCCSSKELGRFPRITAKK